MSVDSVDEYNVIANGVPLINSWRKTLTPIVKSRDSTATMKSAAVEFLIMGDDEEDLATKLRQTEQEFNLRDARCYGYRTADGTAGVNRTFDFHTGDGETQALYSNVSMMPQEDQTELSYYMYLEITCDLVLDPPGTGGINPGILDAVPGLQEALEIVSVYEVGNNLTVSTGGTFKQIIDAESIGPFTVVSVADDGQGRAEITLSGAPAGAVVGDYVTIVNTQNYNGRSTILEISGSDIVINKNYVVNETSGDVNIGAVQTASDLFDASFGAIKTLMGVGTNNLTLVNKTINDNGDGTLSFVLVAQEQEFVPGGIGDGDTQLVRSIAMKVLPQEVDGWEEDVTSPLNTFGASATPPTVAVIDGMAILNRSAITLSLDAHWTATVRTAVITQACINFGTVIGSVQISSESVKFDGGTPAIAFQITVIKDFNAAVQFEYTRSWSIKHDSFIYSRGALLHGIQAKSGEPIKVITRTFSRIGVGEVDLSTVAAPVDAGYTFHLEAEDETNQGPVKFQGITGCYIQTRTETFFRLKLS